MIRFAQLQYLPNIKRRSYFFLYKENQSWYLLDNGDVKTFHDQGTLQYLTKLSVLSTTTRD